MGCSQVARMLKRALDTSLVCLGMTMTVCVSLAQERPADDSQQIIDNLMRRSPEERWQSVKRRYPLENPNGAGRDSAKAVTDNSNLLSDEDVPPSPSEGVLIPRMGRLPVRDPDDWILPARPLNTDEISQFSTPGNLERDPASDPRSIKTAQKIAKRIAALDVQTQTPNPDDDKPRTEQSLVRKMGEIVPVYNRESDEDMREFAVEKAKDYGIDIDRPREYVDRMFPQMVFPWEPSNLAYRPLYFADPALERYGHSHHPFVQPFASIARFGTQFCFMPYQLTIEPPCVEVSPLGWYRPGDCTPKLCYQVPLNAEAAAVQAGYVAGLYFLIP